MKYRIFFDNPETRIQFDGIYQIKDTTDLVNVKILMLKGEDGAGVPSGGTTGQVLTKTAGGVAWQDATGGVSDFADLDDVFIATIGTIGNADGTSYNDIHNAYSAGKIVYGIKDGFLYNLVMDSGYTCVFIRTINTTQATAWIVLKTTNVWQTGTVNLVPDSRTINGKALSSNISLNADDVGAMTIPYSDFVPNNGDMIVYNANHSRWDVKTVEADDVGAIPAPSSPSAGQFLVYDGSAWVAQSLSQWSGGSY